MAKNRGKMTPIQVQMLVDILCENPELASGQVTSSSLSREERNKKWEAIATLLNSKGLGPEKTPDQWRKSWSDLRFSTRSKAAKCELAGGTSLMNDKLSTLEKRVLQLSGDIRVQSSEKNENKQLTGERLLEKIEADLMKSEEELAKVMKRPNQIALPVSISKLVKLSEEKNTKMPIVENITVNTNRNEKDDTCIEELNVDDSGGDNCDSYFSNGDSDDDIVYDNTDTNEESVKPSVKERLNPSPKRRKVTFIRKSASSETMSLMSMFQKQLEAQTDVLRQQTSIMMDIAESLKVIANSLHDS